MYNFRPKPEQHNVSSDIRYISDLDVAKAAAKPTGLFMRKDKQNKTSIHVGEFMDGATFFRERDGGTATSLNFSRKMTVTNTTPKHSDPDKPQGAATENDTGSAVANNLPALNPPDEAGRSDA